MFGTRQYTKWLLGMQKQSMCLGARDLMKTWLMALALLAFSISHTTFIYRLSTVHMDEWVKSSWRAYNYLAIITSMFCFWLSGNFTFIQKQFFGVTFVFVIFTLLITVLTNNLVILKPYPLIEVVDAGTALAVFTILTTFGYHGYFKCENK